MRDILVATPQSRLPQPGGRSTPPVPPGLGFLPGQPSPGPVGDSRPTSRSATPAQTKKGISGSSIAPAVPVVQFGAPASSTTVKSSQSVESKPSAIGKGQTKDEEKQNELTTVNSATLNRTDPKEKSSVVEKSVEVQKGKGLGHGGEGSAVAKEAPAEKQTAKPKPIPGKLDIPDVTMDEDKARKTQLTQLTSSLSKNVATGESGSAVPTPSALTPSAVTPSNPNSRPQTPATAISRTSDSPAPRQPRTLRVLPTQKTEPTSLPSSATQASAPYSTAQPSGPSSALKQRSRQPSLTSFSGPATPVGEMASASDNVSTSASMSCPNSPPPGGLSGVIGSAPMRQMTKSQAKKERQAKAKMAVETKKVEEDPVKPEKEEEVVQAPIVGRKKKNKKQAAVTTKSQSTQSNKLTANESTADVSRPPTPPPAPVPELEDGAIKGTPEVDQAVKESTKKPKEVPVDYSAFMRPPPLDLNQETKPAPQIIQEMIADGTISRDHSFFKFPPSLSHKFDVGPGDYEEAVAAANTPLTAEQKEALRDGQPVRIRTETGHKMGRVLITPMGAVLRALDDEEEERALELEKSIYEASGMQWAFHPDPSSSRLGAAPSMMTMPSSSPFFLESGNFSLNAAGFSSGLPEPASGIPNLALEDYSAMFCEMDEETLSKKAEEIRVAYEASKKETESLEKRLHTIIKKNRRLAGLP
jgi:CCR4-NOT transcription complex subunit 4